jgi:glycosyltransferase involved in cell wall biosynthesis
MQDGVRHVAKISSPTILFVHAGLVSTIIPVYNRAALLRDAVASVLEQSYRPIEIIIVDDGSTDDTQAAIAQLAMTHAEIRSIRIQNSGPGAAREAGRQLANGEYIQHLDSDDCLLPRRFQLLVQALREQPEAGVAYGMTRYSDLAGNEIAPDWKNPNQKQETMFPSFLLGRWWDTPSPLYRRSVTDAAGPWTSLRLEEDWEYDARVASLGTRLAFVPETLVEVRMHGEGHLSRGGMLEPARLRDRAKAHVLIASHARRARIAQSAPEMHHFARALFRLARQCGAAGLGDDARTLFALAREIAPRWDLNVYGAVARMIGWTRAGKLSMRRERHE